MYLGGNRRWVPLTTTEYENTLITIHFCQETLFDQTNCSVLNSESSHPN